MLNSVNHLKYKSLGNKDKLQPILPPYSYQSVVILTLVFHYENEATLCKSRSPLPSSLPFGIPLPANLPLSFNLYVVNTRKRLICVIGSDDGYQCPGLLKCW